MSPADRRPPKSTYQTEEVQEILQLALLQRTTSGELSREQLLELAAELDIPHDALQAAEQDWLARSAVQQERHAFENNRWGKLKQQIGQYAIANSFLLVLNLAMSGSLTWSLYVLLLWGMALSLKIWQTAQTSGDGYERAYGRWQRRRQLQASAAKLWTRIQRALD